MTSADTQHVLRFTFHVSLLLAALLTAAWSLAPQSQTITVTGQVTNGTPGGDVPADLPITLHVFTEMEETGVYTATLSADGSFRFDELAVVEGNTLVARTVYQGVTYVSDFATLEPGRQEVSLPIVIYETTGAPSSVLITQLHIFVNRVEDQLQVGEYYLASNIGERTYVGRQDPETGERTTLTFTLSDEAQNLRFDSASLGGRFLERIGGFADTKPIPPGTATVEASFSYQLPYREGLSVEQTLDVPVDSVALVLPEGNLALEGEALSSEGTLDTQMGLALSYTAGPLAADEPLTFTLVARSRSTVPPASQSRGSASTRNTRWEISLGLVALAAAVIGVYLLWRSPFPGPIPAQVRPQIQAIAALDADFEAGSVSEKTYGKKRRALKRQVRERLAEEQRS